MVAKQNECLAFSQFILAWWSSRFPSKTTKSYQRKRKNHFSFAVFPSLSFFYLLFSAFALLLLWLSNIQIDRASSIHSFRRPHSLEECKTIVGHKMERNSHLVVPLYCSVFLIMSFSIDCFSTDMFNKMAFKFLF